MTLDNRLWAVITAIVCIATLALGWFVGVEPRLAAAARSLAQQLTVDQQNEVALLDIARMQAARDDIDTLSATLADLRRVVPPGVDGTGFIKALDGIIFAHGVQLDEIAIATPAPYAVPPEGDDLAPFTHPLITNQNLVVVPVSVRVVGSNDQVLDFLASLQKMERLILVNEVAKSQDEPGVDVYKLTASGYLYVLRDPTAEAALSAGAADAGQGDAAAQG